jgi:hypothetical protein
MRRAPPEATYAFKHPLVRETAYGMLLRNRRRELHAKAVEALEKRSPELREREPELLAHHYTEAAELEPAIVCWHKEARRSVARSAMIGRIRNGGFELCNYDDRTFADILGCRLSYPFGDNSWPGCDPRGL